MFQSLLKDGLHISSDVSHILNNFWNHQLKDYSGKLSPILIIPFVLGQGQKCPSIHGQAYGQNHMIMCIMTYIHEDLV